MTLNVTEALRAVCRIESRDDKNMYMGHGVFIAPGRVLTAWHVVSGQRKDVTFIDSKGQKATFMKGGAHKKSPDLDLGIIVLDRPIGDDFCFPQMPGPGIDRINRGYLLTHFDNKPAAHPVEIDYNESMLESVLNLTQNLTTSPQNLNYGRRAVFNAAVRVIPGYSGSPIVDANGKVISVVTSGRPERQDMAIAMNSIMQMTEVFGGSRSSNVSSPKIPFMGPTPGDFSTFAQKAIFG